MSDNRPIGVFDSGVGGLTVVRSLLEQLPGESFIYFGDTAHLPYGSKSQAELFQYARSIVGFLLEREVKAIVVACGTHSSVTLPVMERECPVPILGVVKAGADAAAEASRNGKIGIIATQATVNNGSYGQHIIARGPYQVFSSPCPGFVPLVEAGIFSGKELEEAMQEYIAPLLKQGIDTLLLGCTHYPFLSEAIAGFAGPEVTLIDPAVGTVAALASILAQKDIMSTAAQGDGQFFVSGNDQSFFHAGRLLLQGDIIRKVERVGFD
ncbi:MAG TPA: glutamate racemase [Syntrophomonas sp.]|nr:glutamate racemase [Syntrophomonas sp.]